VAFFQQKDPWASVVDFDAPKQAAQQTAPAQATDPYGNPIDAAPNPALDPYDYGEKAIPGDQAKTPEGYELKFTGEHGDKMGFRFSPEQEKQLQDAYNSGDIGQVVALGDRFGAPHGVSLLRESVEASKKAGAPLVLNYAQIDQAAKENADYATYRGFDKQPIGELRKNDLLPETLDATARGGALGADPYIDGVLSSLLHGGTVEDNIARARAIQSYDEQQHPIARLAGGLASSLLLPTKVGVLAREAAGTARADALAAGLSEAEALQAARTAGSQAMARQLLKEGTGYGAAEGAVNSDGSPLGIAEGALGGAALGAATAKVLPKIGTVLAKSHEGNLAPAAEQALNPQQEAYAAAQRQGIEIMPTDVGGPTAQKFTAAAAQTPFGAPPITAAAKRAIDTTVQARDRIAAAVGTALHPEAMGAEVADAARTQFRADKSAASNLYKMAESAAGDTRVTPTKALEALDKNISELREIPGGSEGLGTLQTIREQLASGDHSIAGIRGMRTNLRDQFLRDGLVGSDIERRTNQVVDAAQQDIINSLAANGKSQAAGLYAKGNEAWRELRQREDQVLTPIIGKENQAKSGEAVVRSIMGDMQGNNARAVRLLHALPEESQNNLRASIIGRLGLPGAGARDANNEGFSLPTFLTNWNQIGPTARKAYFGLETRAALDDLAKVAEASKSAQKYLNHSNTSGASKTMEMFTTLTAIPTFGLSAISQWRVGKLLSSPRFARWLARMPRTQLSVPAYVDRLSRIARAEPAIANDVLALQGRLHSAFDNGGIAQAAANQPGNETTGVRQDQQSQEYNDIIDFSNMQGPQ